MEGPIWVAGAMSGTSLDGVDAALLRTDGRAIFGFGASALPALQRSRARHAPRRAWPLAGGGGRRGGGGGGGDRACRRAVATCKVPKWSAFTARRWRMIPRGGAPTRPATGRCWPMCWGCRWCGISAVLGRAAWRRRRAAGPLLPFRLRALDRGRGAAGVSQPRRGRQPDMGRSAQGRPGGGGRGDGLRYRAGQCAAR